MATPARKIERGSNSGNIIDFRKSASPSPSKKSAEIDEINRMWAEELPTPAERLKNKLEAMFIQTQPSIHPPAYKPKWRKGWIASQRRTDGRLGTQRRKYIP